MAQATTQARRGGLWYGWVVLFVNFLVYGLSIGFLAYAPPMIFPAMVTAMGWTRGDATLPVTVGTYVTIFFYPLLGWAVNRFGARPVVVGGTLALGALFLALGSLSELWHWFVLRGLVWPVAAAFGGVIPYQTIAVQWFNLRRGLAVGATLLGAGVFGFIAPPVSTAIMQAAGSWQTGWAAVGVLIIVAAVIGGVFLRSKPADMGTWPDGLPPEEAQRAREAALAGRASQHRAIATTYRSPINWALRDALKTRAVWLTAVGWMAIGGGTFAMNHSVFILRALGYSAMEASFSISLVTGSSSPFRFFMGWLTDRIESRFIVATGAVLVFIGMAMLWAMPPGNMLLVSLYSIVLGVGYLGLIYTCTSVQVGNYFGPASFATVFTTAVLPIGTLWTAAVPALGGYIFDAFKTYTLAFIILMVVAAIGMVASLLALPPRPKEVAPQPVS